MSSSGNYSLLSLPLLAIDRVFEHMDEVSFLHFSLISKKTILYAQISSKRRRPWHFEADFRETSPMIKYLSKFAEEIRITPTNSSKSCYIENLSEERKDRRKDKWETKLKDNSLYPKVFSEDSVNGILKMAQHLIELFRTPFEFVSLPRYCPSASKMIMELLQPSEGLNVDSTFDYSPMDIDFLMKNAARCRRVKIDFDGNCVPSTVDFSNSYFDAFQIFGGKWLKLEHVLAARFKRFYVDKSSLTSTDVNTLIKWWKSGWNPGMREFSTAKNLKYHSSIVLKGLNAEFNRNPRMFRAQNFCGPDHLSLNYTSTFFTPIFLYAIAKGWEIRRESDGFLARIVVSDCSIRIYIWSPEEEFEEW